MVRRAARRRRQEAGSFAQLRTQRPAQLGPVHVGSVRSQTSWIVLHAWKCKVLFDGRCGGKAVSVDEFQCAESDRGGLGGWNDGERVPVGTSGVVLTIQGG